MRPGSSSGLLFYRLAKKESLAGIPAPCFTLRGEASRLRPDSWRPWRGSPLPDQSGREGEQWHD
jgi:hypothetical protein